MYIYFNKFYEATTVIPHGEILRQGGDLNLYVCFDEELIDKSIFCSVIHNNELIGTPQPLDYKGFKKFEKIKDSEITYDLVDGKSYYVYGIKFFPDEATKFYGNIKLALEIFSNIDVNKVGTEENPDYEVINQGETIATATVPAYVEKTFGHSQPNANISPTDFENLKRIIAKVDIQKVDKTWLEENIILIKPIDSKFTENDKNKLFIDETTGDIYTVDNSLEPVIINYGVEELRKFLEEEFQEKLVIDEEPTKDSPNLATSGGIFEAINEAVDKIPVVKPKTENNKELTGLNIDDEDYAIPQIEFELEKSDKGKLTGIKIGDQEYKVDTLDELEKADEVQFGNEKPVTSGAVFEALEEKNDVEVSKSENGYLTGLKVDEKEYEIPLIDFEIFDNEQSGGKELKAIKINGQLYVIKTVGGSASVTVDSSLSSSSTNAVQNRVIYNALEDKVSKVAGKGLSTNDYTTTEKNKLAGLSNYNDSELRNLIANTNTVATEAKSIAEGRSRSFVFETFDSMVSSLETVRTYKQGDNLYIKALKVPDYWVYAVHNTTDEDPTSGRYGYYTIAQLETQKVDLSDYPTTNDMTTAINNAITKVLNEDV